MSIGMRTKRHFFPAGNELTFVDGQLHTDEAYKRRYTQHQFKDYYLIRTGNLNKRIIDAFQMQDPGKHNYTDENFPGGIDVEARFFIWHQYYTPRWDTFESKPNINLVKTTHQQGGKPLTGNLEEQINFQDRTILRESSLMQHALGWQASVELPVDALEEDDKVQIVEIMLEKVALNHHNENYKRFVQIFGVDIVSGSDFGKYFFTVDPEEGKGHPVTNTGGILTSIKAKDIEALQPGAYGFQFFENQIKILPNKILVSLMQQHMIEKQTFEISNTSREASISILDVFTSSPEVLIFMENNATLPHRLKPGDTLKVTVLIIPETLELLECAIYVVTNPKYVFMLPVSIYVTNNMFGIKPHYYSSVNINEVLRTKIDIYNPTDNHIVLLEAYSTEKFVTLHWPNDQDFNSEQTYSKDYSRFLTIPPKEWRTLLTANFFTEQIVDHNAMIHIMLDTGHIMRMPLYYHVYTDIVKFLPSIIDFGVVPLNFDAIRLPVSLKIRASTGIKTLSLTKVLLPLNDVRLDFVMGEWDADPKGHVQVFNKYTKRMEKHRHGIIIGDQEFKLMTVVMKPLKYGMIQTYIKLTFLQENGTAHKIELPIIGFVAPISHLIIERKGNNFYSHVDKQYKMKNPFYGFLPAEPLAQVNVRSYIEEIAAFNQNNTTPRDGHTELPMNIYGDFRGVSTSSIEIIHNIPHTKFEYFQPMYSVVGSMETMQIGQFTLKMKDLYTSNGRKYFFVAASHTFFPQYIQISDQKLICTVQNDSKPNHVSDCESGIHFDFGQIGLYQSKYRTMNITNMGHETVLLDWANKTHPNDELAISYKVSYQEYKSIYPELHPKHFNETETTEFLNRFTNEQRLGLFILPGHTVTFTLSLEGVMASLKAQKQTEIMTHAVNFSFEPFAYRPFKVSYTYQVLRGSLSLLQNEIKFEPGFVGLEQVRELTMKSDFAVDIILTHVHSTDARIMPVMKKKIVAPGEQVVIMELIFDPGMPAVPSQNIFNTQIKPDQQDSMNFTSKKKPWKLSDLSIPNFSTVISEALKTVSEEDVALWRSYQSHSTLNHPTWIDGDWIQGIVEDIRAVVTINTNIVGSVQVPVKAYIKRPQLTEARFINFDSVQVGAYKAQSLELKNPFNETLYVNLFIGRNTVDGSDEAERVNRKLQHETSTELLKHVKGTQYEAILKEEIQSRIDTTIQFEIHQQKLARLPDIQRFCKNVRILAAEKKSPSMQSSPADRKEGEEFQTLRDLESRFQQIISPGMPYEVDLHNDNDLEMCELLHSTMALLPDSHFRASTWTVINQYFFKRHQEVLELEALTNFQKVKEQNNLLVNATDANSLKEHLMYKLQEQLRNMYPDSLKITDDVDYEIAKDINKSSSAKPIMWDSIREQNQINYQLAFPNPFNSGWLNFLSKIFSKKTYLAPGMQTFQLGREILQTKSWAESGSKAMTMLKNSLSNAIEYCLTSNSPQGHSVSKYVSNAFIDNNGRIKGVNPAPALTRQWEIKDPKMHDEILMNNGTVGVEVLSQNFYINPIYQDATFAIEPNKRLLLEDVIIFEPRSLLSKALQMQMTLYLKSDKAVLQTLPLKGWASTALLDITQINKSVSFSNQTQSNSTQIFASYSQTCQQRMQSILNSQSDKKDNLDGDCLDSNKSLELIRNQTLGKSTIPQVVNLHVHDTDVLNFNVESFQKNLFARLLSPFETLSSMQSDYQVAKESQINQVVLWDFTFVNIGEIDLALMNVYLEDPMTGSKSCQQDGVSLWPCIDVRINTLKTKVFSLQFINDFSVSEIRKTIVFESPDFIQRFPVQIDISPKALRYATEYVSDEVKLYRPIFGAISHDLFSLMYLAMLATAGWVAYSLFEICKSGNDTIQSLNQSNSMQFVNKSAQKGQKALESVQNVLASVTPSFVQNQYVNTQERFRSHQSIFLRECVNLSQRKNSITIEYQRNLAIRLGKQQHASIHKSSRPSPVFKATPQSYEERQFFSEKSLQKQSQNPSFDSNKNVQVTQQQQFPPLDAESDGTNTEELMQKTFAPNRKTYIASGKINQRQTQKPKRVNKGKTNYSVDFDSKLQQMEPTMDKEDATSEALAQRSGKHDDEFTLVGQKDINALDSSRLKGTSRASVKDTLSDKPRSRSQSCNMMRENNANAGEEEQQTKKTPSKPSQEDSSSILQKRRQTELSKEEETDVGQKDTRDSKREEVVKGKVQTKDDAAESDEKTSENNNAKIEENSMAAQPHQSLGSKHSAKLSKPRPMNKQEEMSLKKRKTQYDLILKRNLIKKEKEAAEAELARKERDRLKIIQQKEDEERQRREKIQQEQEQIAKLERERELQKKNEQQELENKRMREELEKALLAQQQSNQTFFDARNDSKEGTTSREEQILNQVDVKTKPTSEATKQKKEGTIKTLLKQKTPEADSSFENIQPQSLAQAADPIIPFEEKSESVTPQNKTHRRGISWGMSERLTITNNSDDQSDNSLNFVNQKESSKDQADPRQTPDHQTESSNNSASYNTKGQPVRTVFQSKKQQFQQKQYIAKQQAQNSYGGTTPSKRTDSQDYNPYGPPSTNSVEYTQKLYEEDAPVSRGRGKNVGLSQRGPQARGNRREVVQAEEDYRDSAPPYFQSRRNDREIPGSYPSPAGKYDTRDQFKLSTLLMPDYQGFQSKGFSYQAPRAQNKRIEASYERGVNSDYERHQNTFKQDGRGNPQYPIRRHGNERVGLDYYQDSQPPVKGGYGDLRQQQIYQERRGHVPYQAGGPYVRTSKENLTRRQYEEQNTQNYSAYYSGGKGAAIRGEPQYSGRGRERHQQYLPPAEEDEPYYEEVEYDLEEDYGEELEEEVRPPRAYDLRREPPQQQYEEKGVEERYLKKSQQQNAQFDRQAVYYTNSQQNFYRKKPYQGSQHSQYVNAQYQEDSFTPENEAFNDDEDQEEDYHQQQRRFQSRKDYEIRHSTSQYGGSTQADQPARPLLNLYPNQQQSSYRRFVDDQSQSQSQPQQRYREKVSRQHSGLINQAQPPQMTSRYAVTNNPRNSKPPNTLTSSIKTQSNQVLQASNPSGNVNQEIGVSTVSMQKTSVSPHSIPTYEKVLGPGGKQYSAAQGNSSQMPAKVKKLNYIARGEAATPQKNALVSSAVALHPAISQQPPSSDQSSEPTRFQPKNPPFSQSINIIQNSDNWTSQRPIIPQPSDEDVVEAPMKSRPNTRFLDSEEDEDDLIESTKQFLKRPNSRHNSSVDLEEEEEVYRAPTVQKNFFSNFKRIQSIFNTTTAGPRNNNNEAQDNNDSSQTGETGNAQESSGSLFSGKNLNLFGGPKFDDYFRQDRHQQSLFGGGSSFYAQSADQQDLHSFHPEQQQVSEPQLQKQPSSLEALRMSSRPLQEETVEDYKYGVNPNPNQNIQQTLFSNAGGQDRLATSSQSNSQLQFKKLEPYRPSRLLSKEKAE